MSTQFPAEVALNSTGASRPVHGPAPRAQHLRPLLSDVTVNHGPPDLIGRLFLLADTAARQRGITLSFAPMEDLIAVNRANPDTWKPIAPLFDPASGGITDDNSFCILGHNARGEVVATQAARLYDWTNTSFYDEATSLRLFYADPERMKGPREAVRVTAPAARDLTGTVIYAGAIWYRPDFRGRGFPNILPWLCRTYAYTRWKQDFSLSLITEEIFKRGMAQRSGYSKAEWEVRWSYSALEPTKEISCALVYMDSEELLAGAANFLRRFGAEMDVAVDERRSHQNG